MFPAREAALGIGFFIVAMAWMKALQRTARATGVISGFEWSGAPHYMVRKPRIKFEVDGKEYSFLPGLYLLGDYDESRIGTQASVAYNPSDPRDAELASPVRTYGPPVVLTIIYAVFLIAAFTG